MDKPFTDKPRGDRLCWNWGADTAEGQVAEVITNEVSRRIKGTQVTRQASTYRPVYLVQQDDGDQGTSDHFM